MARGTTPTSAHRIAFAFLMLFASHRAWALDPSLDVNQYAHTSWKIRDGFPRGIVYAIAQAPDGYLWLGTEFGLFRYDGISAVPWQPPAGAQLPGEQLTSLLFARNGVLWIGTRTGVASLSDRKLIQYPQFAGEHVNVLFQDRSGVIWLAAGAPGRVCGVKEAKVACEGAGKLGQGLVDAMYEDRRGTLWVSAETGVWRWKPGPPEHVEFPTGTTQANDFVEDEDGGLLVAANGGGLKLLEGGTMRNHPVPGIPPTSRPVGFLRSSDGSVWIATLDGLFHLHRGRADRYGVAEGLSGEAIQTMYEDREKNVWVSTSGGLDRFRDYVFPTFSAKQGLSSSAVFAVQATADGSIWIAAANGLNRWSDGQVTYYRKHDVPPHPLRRDVPVLEHVVQALDTDENGRLWATTDALQYFDGEGFTRGLPLPRRASAIAHDGRGNVWVSIESEGLMRATADGTVQIFPWSQFGVEVATTIALLPDPERGVWLGPSSGGLFHFDDGRLLASYTKADGLARGRVNHLRLGEQGTIWAASAGGLSRIRDGHILALTTQNGLPCEPVHWSMGDDDHSLWLYTGCGLVRVAGSELDAWVATSGRAIQSTLFDASDGVRSTAIGSGYSPRVTKAPDGTIWFATYDGVTRIDPRRPLRSDRPPPVYVEQITADGKVYPARAAGDGRVRLPARVRDITIDYTALSLVAPEKARFRIKLEGHDQGWREPVPERRVQYTNLRPGQYRFRVEASSDSAVWSEAGAVLDFTIAAAFFETTWFRALCLAAAMASLGFAYRIRVGVLRRRQRLLERHQAEITALNERLIEAQEEERSRIAGELHDGIVQRLTTANLLLGAAKRQLPPDSGAQQSIADSQGVLLGVGSEIRQLSHELHPAGLREAGLPAALAAYCREFSSTRAIPVSCAADDSVKELSPGTALALYRIAQEALGNVAKHAHAKQVDVQLVRAAGVVRLSISDDGVGFVTAGEGESRGVGLVSMRERLRQLGGTIGLESQPGHGTTVRAEVPFRV